MEVLFVNIENFIDNINKYITNNYEKMLVVEL